MFGKITRRNVATREAPSETAASSISASNSSRTGCTVRTTNGSVTNKSATRIAQRVNATSTPPGDLGPYSASSVRPATIVGSANGRSTSALTTPWPKNRSRTSVQAIAVPATALIKATTPDATSVNSSAETACGVVIAFHPCARQPSAASGSRTITLR